MLRFCKLAVQGVLLILQKLGSACLLTAWAAGVLAQTGTAPQAGQGACGALGVLSRVPVCCHEEGRGLTLVAVGIEDTVAA